MREHSIQNEIRIWCGEHNYLCFRCNVGSVETKTGYRFNTGLPNGFPDLLILGNHGDIYFCECKTRTGKQREDQIAFQRTLTERGFKYFVARSIDDVKQVLYNNTEGGDKNE